MGKGVITAKKMDSVRKKCENQKRSPEKKVGWCNRQEKLFGNVDSQNAHSRFWHKSTCSWKNNQKTRTDTPSSEKGEGGETRARLGLYYDKEGKKRGVVFSRRGAKGKISFSRARFYQRGKNLFRKKRIKFYHNFARGKAFIFTKRKGKRYSKKGTWTTYSSGSHSEETLKVL